MKKIIICISMMLAFGNGIINAQSVQRKGNTFTQVSNGKTKKGEEKLTQYTYEDSKGKKYPVFLSSTGKAFIRKISKKTGKEYKQYIPEVGKQINPAAYKK